MKIDRTTAILLFLVGAAAVVISLLLVNIADRSQKNLQEIKAIPVKASTESFPAMPSTDSNDNIAVSVMNNRRSTEVTFREMEFTEQSFSQLPRLERVQVLILSGAMFNNKWLHYLTTLKDLRDIQLDESAINTEGLKQIQQMRQIQELNLKATDVKDDDLLILPPNLMALDICKTKITNAGLKNLLRYPQLRFLNIAGDPITDEGVSLLKNLTKLTKLHLSRLRISDACLPAVRKLSDLEVLDLAYTAISDQGLAQLYGMKKLQKLLIYQCPKVTRAGVHKLKQALPSCEIELQKHVRFVD